ncbi:MAG: bifunctional (p)ppGpp synthetase/guanosine-3',5'-bis(diphosphate) 3'-pyrophosphohydrolase [Pseudomonadota bacterium]|nr:bifunctional (p)ppGpp synthetase/guanosine-3',5'-bis(diphosphate) 3'-pyrophosphohydrolase [Pseudomonadota bacterium]
MNKPHSSVAPDEIFERLKQNLMSYMHDPDIALVTAAYRFSATYHADQKRASGEPYIVHPLEVANILTLIKVDMASIIAAILHDTVEDTDATLATIKQEFGDDVATLVDSLTKISKIKFRSNQERLAENFRKMVVAMAKDLRVILIKLADRLHNMRTIEALEERKRHRIANETLDIYSPLATRLGIYGIKSELEDLCFRQLKYDLYSEIAQKIALKKTERQGFIDEVGDVLDQELRRYGFTAKVSGRPKHFYSIYKKMVDRGLKFEDIHDLFAFRIIVNSIKDCYEALGVVHAMWKPMPGRFKDYIAMPKANLYQSLHTTVIRPSGKPVEVQIRTREMHEQSEYGVAAHALYKDNVGKASSEKDKSDIRSFDWLRQIMQWQSELKDPEEFLEAVRVDLFEEEIFVFTPHGDVIRLPLGGTAIDFAFSVHSDVGLRCVGAKVNGRLTSFKKAIKSGDIVEIVTSPNQKPNKDWLNYVQTSKARNKIRSFLRGEKRERSLSMGNEIFRNELQSRGIDVEKFLKSKEIASLLKIAKENSLNELLIAFGYGKINAKRLLDRFLSDTPTGEVAVFPVSKSKQTRILVSGLDDVLVNFARCCNPLPGEEIIGFVTRGRGVTVHRAACSRVFEMDVLRRINVAWKDDNSTTKSHPCYIRVSSYDKKGVLAEITNVISAAGANITEANIRSQDLTAVHDFCIAIANMQQLQEIIKKIEMIEAVIKIERRSLVSAKSRRGAKR